MRISDWSSDVCSSDLPCVSSTGEDLGHVVAVENFGAGDVVEIERPGGARFMAPMTRVFDIAAAGLIAGTVPTIGRSSALRTAASAMVEAVLHAITTSRGR